jgi:hypothetical protein
MPLKIIWATEKWPISCSAPQGGHCKVAWDTVCRPIEEGGLNVKNLEIQNICHLKFIHKLHTSNQSSWARLIRSFVYKGIKRIEDKMSSYSNAWQYLMSLINIYQNLIIVKLGNGRNTFFWFDSWLENKPLSVQHPALFNIPSKTVTRR